MRFDGVINPEVTKQGLKALGIDELGLERLDREILESIIHRFNGGPVGIDTIAASIANNINRRDLDINLVIYSGIYAS